MTSPYAQYKETQVLTAPPETLVVMLYDGAIRFLEQARTLLERGQDPAEPITRAQDILVELMASLNPAAGMIADNLQQLYQYYLTRLAHAYGRRDMGALREVIQHLRSLREAWAEAARQVRSQERAPVLGGN